VARLLSGPRGQHARVRRAHLAVPYPERFRQDGLLDQETDIETHAAFFRAGIIAHIAFLLAALIGVSLLFLGKDQIRAFHAVLLKAGAIHTGDKP
jgi:hypothetical protein